jgi:hypothetical protein
MNDRIRQLAEQAGFKYINDEGIGWAGNYNASLPKFAELIVQECSKVIVNGGYRNPALGEKHPLTPPEIAKMIQEHFGVEL